MQFTLPNDFLLGAASAATQIEGGGIRHTWSDWYAQGRITDGSNPARANDHYARWKEDVNLMQQMGLQIARIGIEWARIEPEEGVFSEEALEHYCKELHALRECGILPLVTLHHFTNPLWFEEKGGFLNPNNVPIFLRFVETAVRHFGALANEYITINEPNVFAVNGYLFGIWPTGETSIGKTLKVMNTMIECHLQSYECIHRVRKEMGLTDTKVGFANHLRVFTPWHKKNPLHRICAKAMEYLFQTGLSRAMSTGTRPPFFHGLKKHPMGQYCDFHGINYYTRSGVALGTQDTMPNVPINDLGWDIHPEGLTACARTMHEMLPDLPIYITENGTCDNTDRFRCRYLYEHLKAISESKLPITRYYHWCFTDNFEWVEGESARFGLVHVDYETQQRTIKKSGYFFTEIIKNRGVTEQMISDYGCNAPYPTFNTEKNR